MNRQVTFIHIGAPKTGTTFLQNTLAQSREALRAAGVLYPGRRRDHLREVIDFQTIASRTGSAGEKPGPWTRTVREIREWSGKSIISNEFFCASSYEDIGTIVADLNFSDVHVIFTARDLARQLTSVWQENLKNGHTHTFAEFSDAIRGRRAVENPRISLTSILQLWSLQDAATILARWARHIGNDRIHVVTVPPPRSTGSTLADRFAAVTGLDSGLLRMSDDANRSLSFAEAGVLRRLNQGLDGDLNWPLYVSKTLFPDREVTENSQLKENWRPLKAADREQITWIAKRARNMARRIDAAGYDIVGDLKDLLPTEGEAIGTPDEMAIDDQLKVAVEGLARFMRALASERRLRKRAEIELREAQRRDRQ